MAKLYAGSVQIHTLTVGAATVEGVAEDGRSETFGVGAVNAQLMGATRMRSEQDVGDARGEHSQDMKVGDGGLAGLIIHLLTGSVREVGGERKGDATVASVVAHSAERGVREAFRDAVEQCLVALLHLAGGELALHLGVDSVVKGEDKQTACVHIEAVNGFYRDWFFRHTHSFGVAMCQHSLYKFLYVSSRIVLRHHHFLARNGEHTGGLVHTMMASSSKTMRGSPTFLTRWSGFGSTSSPISMCVRTGRHFERQAG